MADRLELDLCDDSDAVAFKLANRIVALSQDAAHDRVAIALSGGSTPLRLYRLLATAAFRDRVNWRRLHWFWGDERFVPADDAASNTKMVREALLDRTDTPRENIHLIPVAGELDHAARAYERDLQAYYGAGTLDPGRPLFDLVLLGMGDDGHTASLFPGKPALDEKKRWVAPVPDAGMTPFVPRLTLTFPAIASSRHVAFLAVGAGKRDMLARIAAGEDFPAARVTSSGDVVWYVDAAAAGG